MNTLPPLLTKRFTFPILWLILPFIGGIIYGDFWWSPSISIYWILPIPFLAFFTLYLLHQHRKKHFYFFISLFIGWFTMGLIRQQIAHKTETVFWSSEVQAWQISVTDIPKATKHGIHFIGKTADNKKLTVYIDSFPKNTLQAGERLLVYSRIKPLKHTGNPGDFNYANYLSRQGIQGSIFCSAHSWSKLPSSSLTISQHFLRWRQQLSEQYTQYLKGEPLSIVAALTLGDKHWLSQDTRQLFSDTGVSHILALSGLHLGILFAIFQWVILRPYDKREWRLWGTLIGVLFLWVYAFLVGLPLSIIRACLMFTISSLASILRRDGVSLNTLTLAALLILFINPDALFDIGFQLSFISVASILCFIPLMKRYEFIDSKRWLKGIYDTSLVTLSAQIGTLPLVAYLFHSIPIYGLLANLLIIPVATLIIITALLFFFFPWCQYWISIALNTFLETLTTVLHYIADLPYSTIAIYPQFPTILCTYILLYSGLWFIYKPQRYKLLWLLSGGISIILVETISRPHITPQWIFYSLRHSACLQAINHHNQSFFWMAPSPHSDKDLKYLQNTCWSIQHLTTPIRLTSLIQSDDIVYQHPLLVFHNSRVAIADSTLPYNYQDNYTPLHIDFLFVTKGYRGGITKLRQWFHPRMIVLDRRLSNRYRHYLKTEAQKLCWETHDLYEKGALIAPLKSSTERKSK